MTNEQFSVSRGNPEPGPAPLVERLHDQTMDVTDALRALDALTRSIIRPPQTRTSGDPVLEWVRIEREARVYRQVLGYPEGDLDG